jgi:hypothetical protein
MTRSYPVSPAPGPLEAYAQCFDDLFTAPAQRQCFRRYMEGLLLPAERSPWEAAVAAGEVWEDEKRPGEWVKVVRSFRDGHDEAWWALEGGGYVTLRSPKIVVATTDPKELADKAIKQRGTWLLTCLIPSAPSGRRRRAS